MNQIQIVHFLHQLRIRILSLIALEDIIVGLQVDSSTPSNEIKVVIHLPDKILTFPINEADLERTDVTLEFIIKRLLKEMYIDE